MFGRRQGLTQLVGTSATALLISVWVLVGCVPVSLPTPTPESEMEAEGGTIPEPTAEMEAEETATPSAEEETADLTPEPDEEAADLTPEPAEEMEAAETPTPSAEEETADETEEGAADATPEAAEESSGGGGQSSGGIDFTAIFPAGHEAESDMLLFNCGSCHSWVCAVIEQRPETHWNTVQASHRDRVSALSDSEFEQLFAFLKENFNDQNPEPPLPDELRNLGCTTQ